MRRVIAVDFDGTLATVMGGPESIPNALRNSAVRDVVNQLYDAGEFIVIYTARRAEDEPAIRSWLILHDTKFDIIECDKLRYDAQIDDRTVSPSEAATLLNGVGA